MITKMTEANKELYYALFEEINSLLGLNIDSIEEYFLHLNTIGTYVSQHEDKTYFLRLPTDENLFEINANTRVINVPAHFKSNGIAVVGDSYAETLWFKIDKYYDIQDLGTDNIQMRIFWELPGTKIKGYSIPQFKDVWSEAGSVLFGWTIPSLLTENSGNLIFSVTFYDDADGNYQFNTLPQTVKIQANNFKLNDSNNYTEDVTSKATVLGRLKNSATSAIFVSPPEFSLYSPASIGAIEVLNGEDDYCYLAVTAHSPLAVGADIEYIWYKGGNSIEGGEEVYLQATEYNKDKIYYGSNLGGDALGKEEARLNFEAGTPIYEKGSQFRVTEVGSYQVKAIAKLTTQDAEGKTVINFSRPSYGSVWTFEKPTAILASQVGFDITEKGIIHGGDNNPELIFTYPKEKGQQQYANWVATIYKDDAFYGVANNNKYSITEEGKYHAEVVKTLNNENAPVIITGKVEAQLAAEAASVINEGTQVVILGTKAPTLTYTNIDKENYTYRYIWYRKAKDSIEWVKVSETTIPPVDYTPNYTGPYGMIIESTYKNDKVVSDTVETLQPLFTVYSI